MAESGRTHKQAKAIAALLICRTVEEAAVAAGVGARTLYRWLGDGGFRLALAEAEGAAIDAAVRRLVALQQDAIAVVGEILSDPTAAPGVRLRAAQIVLDNLLRLRELRDIEERLTRLEHYYSSGGGR